MHCAKVRSCLGLYLVVYVVRWLITLSSIVYSLIYERGGHGGRGNRAKGDKRTGGSQCPRMISFKRGGGERLLLGHRSIGGLANVSIFYCLVCCKRGGGKHGLALMDRGP